MVDDQASTDRASTDRASTDRASTDRASVATGLWLYPDAPVHDLVEAVVAADRGGVDEVWIADEGVARDPWVVFAAAAGLTERVRFGIGITSPVLRHPGAIAATTASLDELSGGRVTLGFGVGGGQSLDPFGLVAERPVALIRDAIRTARSVLRRTPSDHFTPPAHAAPAREVPIFVGSKGEQITRLTSREGDGVFLSGFDLGRVGVAIEWARSVRPIDVALYASVRFDADAPDDPTALRGSPEQVADGMADLVRLHRPTTIGLAIIDGSHPTANVGNTIDAIQRFRASYERSIGPSY